MTDDQAAGQMRVMRRTCSPIGDRGITFTNSFVNLVARLAELRDRGGPSCRS